MILLNGHSLERKDWFRVETMALNLEERNSTATITIGPEAPEIAINDWLQDDTEPGKGIVWRVRTVTQNVETRTRTIQLEHIIQLLKDRVLFGEIKPDTITGDSSAEKCTAWEAADYIMRRQTEWQLGQIEGSRSAPYNFNGDTLFTALETVTGSLPDMQWEYDLRSMPFTLNIMRHPTGFQSEMRMRRNISTMRIQIDKTRMYTRLYPIGKNNLHISGDYVSKNEWVWGRVDKVLTDQTRESEEDLLGWAQDNLNRHCEPLVTVTITGLELSASTGEPLDHIVVGRRCRMPIPKYGIWMTERVTKMSWADKIKEPQKVTVTLANQLEDVASIINQQNTSTASSSASGRRGAKQAEEDHAWFVDTTDHVAMVAEAVAGEGAATDWSRVAQVMVDGKGVHQRVTQTENDIVTHEARIEVTEQSIQQEVTARGQQGKQLHSEIMQTATQIYQYVENEADDMRSEIRQTASRITLAVEKKSDNFFQYDDPKTSPPEGKKVTEGSIWVKSNDIRHYGDAEVFTWGDLGGYAWADFYGSEIYIWENGEWKLAGSDQLANINRTRIDQTDEHIALIADNFDGNWSAFVVEAGRIRSEVNSIKSDMGSIVEQTADMIRTAVFTANSTLYSEIKQTATQIYAHVEDENERIGTELSLTASSIRTEVGTKSRVFRQWTNPVYDDATRPDGYHVQAGDFWVVDNEIHTYGQAEQRTYGQLGQFDWKAFFGCTFYVYDGSTWIKVSDDQLNEINHTYGEETREHFYRVAEDLAHNRAELELTKSQFRTQINTAKNEFGSSITQTARQIRSEVHAGQSTVYSEIIQTATNIYQHVADTKQGLESSIEIEKNRISLVVQGTGTNAKIKPAEIVASINDGESTIVISADHLQLNGLVKASDLTTDWLKTKMANVALATLQSGSVTAGWTMNGPALAKGGLWATRNSSHAGVCVNDEELMIRDISVSGDTMTITKVDGTTINFSKPAASIEVSGWDRDSFSSSNSEYNNRDGRKISFDVSVKVNGTTYSHTFTTGNFKLAGTSDHNKLQLMCGSTRLGYFPNPSP